MVHGPGGGGGPNPRGLALAGVVGPRGALEVERGPSLLDLGLAVRGVPRVRWDEQQLEGLAGRQGPEVPGPHVGLHLVEGSAVQRPLGDERPVDCLVEEHDGLVHVVGDDEADGEGIDRLRARRDVHVLVLVRGG